MRSVLKTPAPLALLTALGLGLSASSASAQETEAGLALNRFDPAPAGDRMFGVPSPFVAGDGVMHVMLLGDYAHRPLVIITNPDTPEEAEGAVVEHQGFAHINMTAALWDRLHFNIDLPVALIQDGESPTAGSTTFSSPTRSALGDLRLGARVRLYGEYEDRFQLGLGTYLWLPTGSPDEFVGTGKVRVKPQLIAGGRGDRYVWSAAVGPQLRDSKMYLDAEQGSTLEFGAGLGFLLDDERRFQIGPEFYGGITLEDVGERTTNAEILLDARYRITDDVEAGLGAGPGLSSGVGTPDFRAVAMLAYTPKPTKAAPPPPPPPPTPPPPPPAPADRDFDGIHDDVDACPDVVGEPNEDPTKHGCAVPKDQDGDGITDDQDACVTVAGIADPDPAKNGCPPPADQDGDGVLDEVDACPQEAGPADPDPAKNGCPTVRVTESEIVIGDKVQFDTAAATIKPASDALLDQIAEVLKGHPEILVVEVQGHTDDRGNDAYNQRLSDNRAKAVKRALEKRGVEAQRLRAKGYGEAQPIAPNDTEEGQEKNRRVQFKIVEKKPAEKPPAASTPAPATAPPATPTP